MSRDTFTDIEREWVLLMIAPLATADPENSPAGAQVGHSGGMGSQEGKAGASGAAEGRDG